MPQNFYELVWIFIIYAFIGWCTEVSYAALDTGKFVNRGFLKRSVLSDLWVRRGDCGGHPDTSERKSADPVCRIFSSHLCAGVHYGLYSGKSISQQVVGLF